MSYSLITDDNGYGRVFYTSPCGAKIPILEVWYDIRNDQDKLEAPIVSFCEKVNSVKMINEAMRLVNNEVSYDG